MKIIAHRGASHAAPENTLAAFREAWEQGADGIEADLRLTADDRIVAFHDPDGRRLLRDPRAIRSLTLEELRRLDAGGWKADRWSGERVPTLEHLLATVPEDGEVVLELKEADAVCATFAEILRSSSVSLVRTWLIAFDSGTIAAAKALLPACRALWLFSDYRSLPRDRPGEWLRDRAREFGVDDLDLRCTAALDARLLAPLVECGMPVFTYTVNTRRAALRCAQLGLTGITTDRPADARRWLAAISA